MQNIYNDITRLTAELVTSVRSYDEAYRNYYDTITRAVSVTDAELAQSLREEAECIDVYMADLQESQAVQKKTLVLLKKCRVEFIHENLPESIREHVANHRIRPYNGKLEQFAVNAGITIVVESIAGHKTYGRDGDVVHCIEYNGGYYLV